MLLPPEYEERHAEFVNAYLGGRGQFSVLGKVRRFEIINKQGERIPIQLKAFETSNVPGQRRFGAMMEDLRARIELEQTQQALMSQLERLALTDALTSLPNRRAFFPELARAQAMAARNEEPISVAVIDIDHFKQINDAEGHEAGDEVLQHFASRMAHALRAEDFIARLGGEEFALILPNADAQHAAEALSRVLETFRRRPIELTNGHRITVSFSGGVTALPVTMDGAEAVRCADKAMYGAKRNGRARIEIWRGPMGTPKSTARVQTA